MGFRHKPVVASLPWAAGWWLSWHKEKVVRYSKLDLQQTLRQGDAKADEFKREVQCLVTQAVGRLEPQLNQQLLKVCQRFFLARQRAANRSGDSPIVVQGVREMWRRFRLMKHGHGRNGFGLIRVAV